VNQISIGPLLVNRADHAKDLEIIAQSRAPPISAKRLVSCLSVSKYHLCTFSGLSPLGAITKSRKDARDQSTA
jgi:hypothetical protein